MVIRTIGLVVALTLSGASLAAAETKNIDRTLPLSVTGTVELEAHNGWIQVRTWDRPEVEVHVRIEWSGAVSSYRVRTTTVDVDGSADRVSIRWNDPDRYSWTLWSLLGGDWAPPDVHYYITAPRNARLDIRSHNANTDIRDVNAAVRVATHNGATRIDFASFTQDSRIATHNGAVEVILPAASRFRFESRGHNGRVDSDFPPTTHASYYGRHGGNVGGTVNGGGPDLSFISHNGSVRLRSK